MTTLEEPGCRGCGCAGEDCCCIMHTGIPCWWVAENLCFACAGENPCQGETHE